MTDDTFTDYYELLQVSPNAEAETIQRVFRMLAQRFHPDNSDTGDEAIFQHLLKAYQVLTDPERRAAYDVQHRKEEQATWQVFDQPSAAIGKEGEKRKRMGILGLLYRRRVMEPERPGMTAREMEPLLGIPKEHLEFPLWYLKENNYIKAIDNGRFIITVRGVDHHEGDEVSDEIQRHLLPAPREPQTADA